jgi:capsular exopolysaccharide synthesis family protein
MKRKNKSFSYVPDQRSLIVLREPNSFISEQYRAIRTSILFSIEHSGCISILFTSDMPEAGKSTTASNVAVVFAQTGKKTLLIDADLRRPTSHYTFEVSNHSGLSTTLVNDVSIEEVMKKTKVDGLDIITSGPIPPNPSELISRKKMEEIMDELKQLYDIIIVDSPPIVPVIDAQVISKFVNGTVIVTNVEHNDSRTLKEAKDLLVKTNTPLLGIILNQKKQLHNQNYYRYSGGG